MMVFEGVNDIGVCPADLESQEALETSLIAGYCQIATRVYTRGMLVFAATITPFGAAGVGPGHQTPNVTADANPADGFEASAAPTPYSHPVRERTRQRINDWIRTSGVFDFVVDFDKVLRDPKNPSRLAKEYDSGDHLHPNETAFHAMADAFPVDILRQVEE